MRRWLILAAIALAFGGLSQATTHHVPSQFGTIQEGVDAAQVGDTVLVAAGTYHDVTHFPPPPDTTRCAVIMKSGVTLKGAGQDQTILDCQDLGRGIHCQDVTDALIEGFTITNAFAEVFGAAIFCRDGSSPTITECEITECGDGGIISIMHSNPTIYACEITNNGAKQGGGIAFEDESDGTVYDCRITGNHAPLGGGLYVRAGSSPVVHDCIISNNYLDTENGQGGGVTVISSSLTISNCEINNNLSTGAGGGFAVMEESTVNVLTCFIQGNTTTGGYGPGGGVYADASDVILDRCVITRNDVSTSFSDGGGIYGIFATSLEIYRCTIAANISDSSEFGMGSGIGLWSTDVVVDQTIIAFNTPNVGLNCDVDEDPPSNPVLTCCDVYGNAGGDWVGCIAGQAGIDGNFSTDPLFCDMPNDEFGLHIDSPCLPGNHPDQVNCGPIGALGYGDCDGVTEVPVVTNDLITSLYAAPNPFRPSTKIYFELSVSEHTTLKIFDVGGRGSAAPRKSEVGGGTTRAVVGFTR